jgi:hypothetical protein
LKEIQKKVLIGKEALEFLERIIFEKVDEHKSKLSIKKKDIKKED